MPGIWRPLKTEMLGWSQRRCCSHCAAHPCLSLKPFVTSDPFTISCMFLPKDMTINLINTMDEEND